mmetsp:Transcript_66990/g.174361  ORF Transcript_66990/g.174361 Transcript_66990/m.174361 type:complete len:331 (-) Transcript_66990:396-1388(-)
MVLLADLPPATTAMRRLSCGSRPIGSVAEISEAPLSSPGCPSRTAAYTFLGRPCSSAPPMAFLARSRLESPRSARGVLATSITPVVPRSRRCMIALGIRLSFSDWSARCLIIPGGTRPTSACATVPPDSCALLGWLLTPAGLQIAKRSSSSCSVCRATDGSWRRSMGSPASAASSPPSSRWSPRAWENLQAAPREQRPSAQNWQGGSERPASLVPSSWENLQLSPRVHLPSLKNMHGSFAPAPPPSARGFRARLTASAHPSRLAPFRSAAHRRASSSVPRATKPSCMPLVPFRSFTRRMWYPLSPRMKPRRSSSVASVGTGRTKTSHSAG